MNCLKLLKLKNVLSSARTRFLVVPCSLFGDSRKLVSFTEQFYEFSCDFPEELKKTFINHFVIRPDFINDSEEVSLLNEIEPLMRRMRYQFDHWDNAIQGFRETERAEWKNNNSQILQKLKNEAFVNSTCMSHAHILDLDENGHIKPHIDSVRFCGNIIAGLNLLSDAVMRLQKNNGFYCDVFLKRRSFYIMSGPVRNEFTHEILPKEKSQFRGSEVIKKRRISLILRSEPDD